MVQVRLAVLGDNIIFAWKGNLQWPSLEESTNVESQTSLVCDLLLLVRYYSHVQSLEERKSF